MKRLFQSSLARLLILVLMPVISSCNQTPNLLNTRARENGAVGPASIAISSGNTQTANILTALSSSLVVVVKDANFNVVAGVTINWTVVLGAGSISSATSITNASGLASNVFTLGAVAGTNNHTVTATVDGYPSLSVTFTASATTPTLAWTPLTNGFGNILAGTNSATQDFTLTNSGNGPATGCSAPALSDTTNFTITADACGTNDLAAAGTCIVTVRANPGLGAQTATLSRACTVVGTPSTTANLITATGICPTNYIAVPANATVDATNAFCVMQFEAKDVGGVATSQALLNPWANITAANAQTECTDLGAKYDLISNPEWMAIARNIEVLDANWSGGVVGVGQVNRGHADNSTAGTLAVTDTADPYNGTGDNAGEAVGSGWEQKRTHTLSNGNIIWDFAGNIGEMVDWSIAAGLQVIAGANKAYCNPPDAGPVSGNRQFNSINSNVGLTDVMKPATWQPADATYNITQGIGNYNSRAAANDGLAIRGGLWNGNSSSGIYALSLESTASVGIFYGFRCVYRP